jgi:MoaA/NifB/PqqE/SkfB family radical SAM enzyme
MKKELILDSTKIMWHRESLEKWKKGERFAPITIDMALTRACNYKCVYCYSQLQDNHSKKITIEVMKDFLDDCADMGVKAISLVSDGESTVSPIFADVIKYGHSLGIDMACGSNGYLLTEEVLEEILPCLTYLRFNITAGEPERYSEIMGVPVGWFYQVKENIKNAVSIKKEKELDVTIGMQMVLMPEFADQIIPLTKLARELKPDYLVIKHCSDDEEGQLGVDYTKYKELEDLLKEAEAYSDDECMISVKWSKIQAGNAREYEQCYGAPFIIQISGSGLLAPCGCLFNDKYKKYHIGNIVDTSFKEMLYSDRYWDVMNELASDKFNARTMCGCLCLQHKVCDALDKYKKGQIDLAQPDTEPPMHINFI